MSDDDLTTGLEFAAVALFVLLVLLPIAALKKLFSLDGP